MSYKKVYTLALVRDGSKLLLGLKKRGFGCGKWNGFGGKVDQGETIDNAALRELEEESCIKGKDARKVGIIDFEFEGNPELMEVHIYSVTKYEGEPTETEEMKPSWFGTDNLPYDKMWADDRIWYPIFLKGCYFRGYAKFRGLETMLEYKFKELSSASLLDKERHVLLNGDGNTISTNSSMQTDLTIDDINVMEAFRTSSSFLPPTLENNLDKLRYYTGLTNYQSLMVVFNLVAPYIRISRKKSLNLFQELMMVLLRLRLGLQVKDLSYRFGVSITRTSTIFNKWIRAMECRLKVLTDWPQRGKNVTPDFFMELLGSTSMSKFAVIVDCIEILIERPSNLVASTVTWSSNKQHHTVKYLIGATPKGEICFVSDGWGGLTPNWSILERSESLWKKLSSRDVILVDCKFLKTAEKSSAAAAAGGDHKPSTDDDDGGEGGKHCLPHTCPGFHAFTKDVYLTTNRDVPGRHSGVGAAVGGAGGCSGGGPGGTLLLRPVDLDESMVAASPASIQMVRAQVRESIQCIKECYQCLGNVIPLDYVDKEHGASPLIDSIVRVCSALHNIQSRDSFNPRESPTCRNNDFQYNMRMRKTVPVSPTCRRPSSYSTL